MVSHINSDLVQRLKPANPLGKYNEEIEFIKDEKSLDKNKEFLNKALVQKSESGRVSITDQAGIPLVKERPGFTIFFTKIPEVR